jgi:hypothetical protein
MRLPRSEIFDEDDGSRMCPAMGSHSGLNYDLIRAINEVQNSMSPKIAVYALLKDILRLLGDEGTQLSWTANPTFRLGLQESPARREIFLGYDCITSHHESGIEIRYTTPDYHCRTFRPNFVFTDTFASNYSFPLIPIKASRLKPANPAEIFCEMLAVNCHPEVYDNPCTMDQEAYVIHNVHDEITVWFARLPNSYLRAVHLLGKDVLREMRGELPRVILRRTRPFRVLDPEKMIAFVREMVEFLGYIKSGEAPCSILYNWEGNPLYFVEENDDEDNEMKLLIREYDVLVRGIPQVMDEFEYRGKTPAVNSDDIEKNAKRVRSGGIFGDSKFPYDSNSE